MPEHKRNRRGSFISVLVQECYDMCKRYIKQQSMEYRATLSNIYSNPFLLQVVVSNIFDVQRITEYISTIEPPYKQARTYQNRFSTETMPGILWGHFKDRTPPP